MYTIVVLQLLQEFMLCSACSECMLFGLRKRGLDNSNLKQEQVNQTPQCLDSYALQRHQRPKMKGGYLSSILVISSSSLSLDLR